MAEGEWVMNKTWYYVIVGAILILFIALMNSGNYLRKPMTGSDDVAFYLEQVENKVNQSKWEEAQQDDSRLNRAWKQIIPRIQFSVEKDEINAINVSLARLSSYIGSRDKTEARAELREAREHWASLNH